MRSRDNVNKVFLIGNVGMKPELRHTPAGHAVVNLALATSRTRKESEGVWSDVTDWHRLVVWGRRAENCERYLDKGNRVYVEGSLQTSTWKDEAGLNHYRTEVVVEDIKFLGQRKSIPASAAAAEPEENALLETST